ncbi:MAG: hypothetical protein NTU67_10145 [Gemmatimonadetes bacterium]|nr:hypothetical protein [Gemmatimonadota bacterium]
MSIYQLDPGVVARCLFCRQNAVSVRELSGRTFDLRDEYDLRFDESIKGSRNLSTPLEVLMRGVTREPKQTLRMIGYSRRLPPALAARIK